MFYGHFAVSIFLVLSGFCLMLPVARSTGCNLRGGVVDFYRRRARRILPPYYAAMALSLLLIWTIIGHKTGTHWDLSVPVTAKGIAIHALLLQNIFPSDEINHVFWSIAVEWQIYFVFPLLLISWRRIGATATTALAVILSICCRVILQRLNLPIIAPHYLGLFALGMFAATAAHSTGAAWEARRTRLPWGPAAAILAIAIVALCAHFRLQKPHLEHLDFLVGLCAVCTLVHLSCKTSPLRRILSWKPLMFVGGFSYSLYLIHAPLIQIVSQYCIFPLHIAPIPAFLLTMGISVPISLFCAYLFFLIAERPFTSAVKRK
jgi:peptidoglycan/LPS O-acetylase OafA/YrhL